MWTRSKDKTAEGKFEYALYDNSTLIERVGGFNTAQEADRAGELAQRRALFPAPVECDMTDEELLAELFA